MRLQKSLFGPARDAVKSMLFFPNDVGNVMEELAFRFGRPELLLKAPIIQESKPEQIIEYSTKIRNAVSFLGSANCQQHLKNPTLLDTMVLKLPPNKQLEWVPYAVNIQPYATFAFFCQVK